MYVCTDFDLDSVTGYMSVSLKSVGCDDGTKVSLDQKQDIMPKVKRPSLPKRIQFFSFVAKN